MCDITLDDQQKHEMVNTFPKIFRNTALGRILTDSGSLNSPPAPNGPPTEMKMACPAALPAPREVQEVGMFSCTTIADWRCSKPAKWLRPLG